MQKRNVLNSILDKRLYLTEQEVMRLAKATKATQYAVRNHAIILCSWRHGLRASEVGLLRWEDINFDRDEMFVRRLKGSVSGGAPLWPDERTALLKLWKQCDKPDSGIVFRSEKGNPMTRSGLNQLVKVLGKAAQFSFAPNFHQLRHGCGYYHINRGASIKLVQRLMGHKSVTNTDHYTQLAPGALRELL